MLDKKKELDKHIIESKNLLGDFTDRKVIAFKVEWGEFLNEHRFFKFWSNDQEPRYTKLLEEFVDCIHFMCSLAIERHWDMYIYFGEAILARRKTFEELAIDIFHNPLNSVGKWQDAMSDMLQFVYKVGYTTEAIEKAYDKKNRINHKRQEDGY